MLDAALLFLKDELNTYVRTRTGAKADVVTLSRVVTHTGAYAFEEEKICLSIVNIEEERATANHVPERVAVTGGHVVLDPEVRLNLFIILAANFKNYDVGLRYLSYVITFFQSHPVFTPDAYPALNGNIDRLLVELQTLTFEQLNQMWGFIGGKQLPSMVYKVRTVKLQDREALAVGAPPITRIRTDVRGK